MDTRTRTISKENLDEVHLEAFLRRFQGFAPRRRLVILPLFAWFFLFLLLGDRSIWRACVLGLAALVSVVGVVHELRRGNWLEAKNRLLRGSILGTLLSVALVSVLTLSTGGFDSPVLPFSIAFVFLLGTITDTRKLVLGATACSAVVVGLSLVSGYRLIPDLMPAVFGGGAGLPQPRSLLIAKALVLVLTIVWAAVVSRGLRLVFRDIVSGILDARDEVLQSHDAHARELTALSGELAHELKNPLANIKGLAVLVSRDVHGKGAERIEVLQHEVTRMEEILQSFLTFSRPLSPLNAERVDLRELCESVLALHEGIAQTRGVTLELKASSPVPVSCDSRKTKQILINLVQNALEASPPGATVELLLSPAADGGARVEVRDRGEGLAQSVRTHLFEPGTTTKERGTGLGLALARGLARQHGGNLFLENRETGGCKATLELPASVALPLEEATS